MSQWIQKAIKHPGALHKALGVKGKIPAGRLESAAAEGGKVGREARLAMTLRKMHTGRRHKLGNQ